MKIKRLLALVMSIAMLASLCSVVSASGDKVTVANYYDTSANRGGGLSGWGFNGDIDIEPKVKRAPLDLDAKANWSKVGAVAANNLDFVCPATKDADGNLIQDMSNVNGMTYIVAKIVEDAGKDKFGSGKHYPDGELPYITYEVKADAGKYLTSIDVTAWGCVMYGGTSLDFYVTPENPAKVTDPEYKKLSTIDYLWTFGSAYSAPTHQSGNYKNADGWKFDGNSKLEYCGLAEQKSTKVYVTVVFNAYATKAGEKITNGTDGADQIRYTGIKITAGQADITAYDPSEKKDEPSNVDTGDSLVISVAALAVVSGAAVVLATRKKKEN